MITGVHAPIGHALTKAEPEFVDKIGDRLALLHRFDA
jgi:hypothetical protein